MRVLCAAVAAVLLVGCSRVADTDGQYAAFMRSCEPQSVRADTTDGDGTSRTLVVSCAVVKR